MTPRKLVRIKFRIKRQINSLAPFTVLITNYLDNWNYLMNIGPMVIVELLEK